MSRIERLGSNRNGRPIVAIDPELLDKIEQEEKLVDTIATDPDREELVAGDQGFKEVVRPKIGVGFHRG